MMIPKKVLALTLLSATTSAASAFAPTTMGYHHLDVSAVGGMSRKDIHLMNQFSARGGGFLKKQSSQLSSTSAGDGSVTDGQGPSTGGAAKVTAQPLDVKALAKWTIGYVGQVSLIYGALLGVDAAVAKYSLKLPFWSKVVFFYLFQQATTFFSLLPRKPTGKQKLTQKDWEYNKREQPSWTPPGFVFALMWPLFVFGTRAVTSAMVATTLANNGAKQVFSSVPVMILMGHLCIANLWNTVNNVEKRLGPCVPLLWALAASKAAAAYAFYQVNPLAGKALALTLTWLTAAAALETDTWRINPDLATGKKEKLYPVKNEKWVTKFRWES